MAPWLCTVRLATLAVMPWVLSAADVTTLEGRRAWVYDKVLAYYASHKNQVYTFQGVSALFAQGEDTAANTSLPYLLSTLEPGNTINKQIYGGNSGFVVWPAIDCYRRFHTRMTPEIRERFRRIFTGAVWYQQLTTSNHQLMAAVTRYLATEVWGEEAFVPDPAHPADKARGSYFNGKDRSGLLYLRQRIDSAISIGPGEYASRPYGDENLLPLLSLADCASDGALANRARLAYEAGIVQLAPVWQKGHLATFSTRSYPDMLTQQPWGIGALMWVYFGGVAGPNEPHKDGCVLPAVSAYAPPAVLQAAGTDRSTPYRHRALMNGWALDHWTDQTYSIFSRSPKAKNPKVLGQNYPTGVMWDEPDVSRFSQFWVTNPARDDDQTWGLHTHGVNAFEQQVQRQGTVLSVYDIPANYRAPYLLGYAPGGWRAMINDSTAEGRLYLHYGTVLIGLTASTTFTWDPTAPIRWPATKPRTGDSEFRIPALQSPVATKVQLATLLETSRPGAYPGATPAEQLAAFRAAIRSGTALSFTAQPAGAPSATATDRLGGRLSLTYNGTDTIDDVAVNYAAWPILESPWIRQTSATERSVTDGSTTEVTVIPAADYTDPVVTVTAPAVEATVSGSVTVSFTATDNVAVTETRLRVDGVAATTTGGGDQPLVWDSTTVPDGSHVLTVVALDAAGNEGLADRQVTVDNPDIDTRPPVVAITRPVDGDTLEGLVEITVTATDDQGVVSSLVLLVDGVATTLTAVDGTFSWDSRLVADGLHTLTIRATDPSGNAADTSVSVDVDNPDDTTPPVVVITSPATGTTLAGNVTLAFTATDDRAVTSRTLEVNGVAVTASGAGDGSFTWNSRLVPNGTHRLAIVAQDLAGNRTRAEITVTIANPGADGSTGTGGSGCGSSSGLAAVLGLLLLGLRRRRR